MGEKEHLQPTRVIKAKDRPKAGVIIIEKAGGEKIYRCPCDVCDEIEEVRFLPRENRVFHCGVCRSIATRGKTSTYYSRKGTELRFHTECDRCSAEQETTFLPGRDRVFYCDDCMRENKGQTRREKPMKAGVKVLGTEDNPRFEAPCDDCQKRVEIAFAPRKGERFTCSSCFAKSRQKARQQKEKPETRVMFNIECVQCGRTELVDFVPTLPAEALCSRCFPSKKDRRRK